MQFSEHWLRQYVNPTISSDALGDAMTMAGLEVEACEPVAQPFTQVVIGEILEAIKHEDADRLQVCKVDVGTAEPLQIVCGAPNARVGLKVACAQVGAVLPGFAIKRAKVRGVESFGMLCSAKELGIAEDADGILVLSDNAEVGQDIRDYLSLDDHLFTLKLTPNRADCLSILGIARDVAAITGAPITLPASLAVKASTSVKQNVTVSAAKACPSYFGLVIEDVNAQAATPGWMQRVLERSGISSISAIVDITNYVLLELGQPMHAFDLAKINGEIDVRFAKEGESIKLLNDAHVKLENDDLVITDANGPIALAGIMGGDATAVSDATSSIFLESAFFTPDVMAGKARRLGLSTDSSYRFERGVDYGNTKNALARATALIVEVCGGKVGVQADVIGSLPSRNEVSFRYKRLVSVLGIDISKEDVAKLLTQLSFQYKETSDGFLVQAPTYRFDIAREEDLIEEIARLHGYDKIPAITPEASLSMLPKPEAVLSETWLKDSMQGQGYQEVITYSFVEESWERDLLANADPIKLKNPIASNMSVMRTSLFGGLLDVLVYNLNRKQERAMLFEVGSTFHRSEQSYREQNIVAGIVYGAVAPEQWASDARDVDFYDMKAAVDVLTQGKAEYRKEEHPALHPGQTARIYLEGKAVGWLGKLHPKWQQHYDLVKSTILFELETAPLLSGAVPIYEEVPKSLAVRRDIAVVVDADVEVQVMIDAAHDANIPMLYKMQLFDIYQGKGIAESKKSLAFLILMQDTHKTLIDNEADAAIATLLQLLEDKFDAQLRN